VLVEGYPPPGDPRLNVVMVTPDRGVVEVNVHPANSWQEMVEITTGVYKDSRHARLGTEKFMLDGRHRELVVATIWLSEARLLQTALSCGGPIYCAAWLAIGKITPHYPTCSRVFLLDLGKTQLHSRSTPMRPRAGVYRASLRTDILRDHSNRHPH
jgi:hypothetical protein